MLAVIWAVCGILMMVSAKMFYDKDFKKRKAAE